MISVRKCSSDDLTLLAEYNKRLIEDEKSDNPMDTAQLRDRMKGFLETDYDAYLFGFEGNEIGYALVKTSCSPLYLRQFFIDRPYRRRHFGEQAFRRLLETLNTDRIDVEVLVWNEPAVGFWRKMGFEERSLYMRRETRDGTPSGTARESASGKLTAL